MTLGGDSLAGYYKTCFDLMHFHKWSLQDIESMYPFELDAYKILLINHLQELERIRQAGGG
jgi:hypothetical protein